MLCRSCNDIRFPPLPPNFKLPPLLSMATSTMATRPKDKSTTTSKKSGNGQQSKAASKQESASKQTPISLLVEQSASVFYMSQISKIKAMDRVELVKMNTDNLLLQDIRDSIVQSVPAGTDEVIIANHSLCVHNKLKDYVISKIVELSVPRLSPPSTSPENTSDDIAITPPDQTRLPAPSVTAARVPCLETCTLQHLERGKSIECGMCQSEYHKACVGKPSGFRSFWICPMCQDIPRTLKNLTDKQSLQAEKIEELKDENKTLMQIISDQRAEIQKLVIAQEKPKLNKPTSPATPPKQQKKTQEASSPRDNTKKDRTLLVGDSIIKGIQERGLQSTTVKCIRGAKVKNIKDNLKDTDIKHYETIMVHVGTNDCSSDAEQKDATKEFKTMVEYIKTENPTTKIIISSVCPRADNADNNQRGRRLNDDLKSLARDELCSYVDNDGNFLRHNGTIDETNLNNYKLHLSSIGTRNLLGNLSGAHAILKPRTKTSSSSQQRERENSPYNRQDRRRPTSPGPRQYRQRPNVHQLHRPGHSRSAYKPRARGCDFCGLQNHTTGDCHHRRPVECFSCHGHGHKSGQCPASNFNRDYSNWD